jgi:hypothetical protein
LKLVLLFARLPYPDKGPDTVCKNFAPIFSHQ